MSAKKTAPVPVATRDEVDAWYRQGLLDPAQHDAMTAQLEGDAVDDTPAAA